MTNPCDVTISVLGFQEDGEWCALALEMDLRGYGQTFAEALEDLDESMAMQIGFARFKGEMDMIFHPAEPMYLQLFERLRNARIMALAKNSLATEGEATEDGYAVTGMPIPPAHVIAAWQDKSSTLDG